MEVLCTENAMNLFGFVQMKELNLKNYPGLVYFMTGITMVALKTRENETFP